MDEDEEIRRQSLENLKAMSAPEGGLKMKIIFVFFGIGSLLAWNAILSDLDFFNKYQSKYEPDVSFSFLNFSLNILFQFLLLYKKNIFPVKFQLIFGLIASIISLIILPIIVTSFKENSLTGFIITAVIILFQGFVNALCCSGFFGLASYFPIEMIIALCSGQGVSGIMMNVIQYIILFSVKASKEVESIIFFSISGFILLISLIVLFIAFNSEYFKYYLNKENDEENNENENLFKNENEVTTENVEQEKNLLNKENGKEISFMELFKLLKDIDFLACYIYIVTFILFPSVALSQKLFNTGDYRVNTIITIYNVFDTVGRLIISKITPTKKITYIVILSRTILIFTLIFNYYCDLRLNWSLNAVSIILIVNVVVLATTNGMGASLCLGIAPTLVPSEVKGKAGSSISFFNILGIFLGSCLAFGSKAIMKAIEPKKTQI